MTTHGLTRAPVDEIEVLLRPADLRAHLELDARVGLTAARKWLPPKYFYDDLGSRLFEEITRLPEYYPTRAERAILARHADEIAAAARATTLLELGSGSSEKTRLLLDAMQRTGQLAAYVPVDVSAGALRQAMTGLRQEYPTLQLRGAVADFDHHLDLLPAPGIRLFALLGGTIGNYPPTQRRTFLTRLTAAMRPGETFLLGIDLVKAPERLVSAYDDHAGVTAAFNRNVLRVLNTELLGDLDVDAFDHVAIWDPEQQWIEMRLRARRAMSARLKAIDLDIAFARGEHLRTEISAKFHRGGIESELRGAGLTVEGWWTDDDFALVLARL